MTVMVEVHDDGAEDERLMFDVDLSKKITKVTIDLYGSTKTITLQTAELMRAIRIAGLS